MTLNELYDKAHELAGLCKYDSAGYSVPFIALYFHKQTVRLNKTVSEPVNFKALNPTSNRVTLWLVLWLLISSLSLHVFFLAEWLNNQPMTEATITTIETALNVYMIASLVLGYLLFACDYSLADWISRRKYNRNITSKAFLKTFPIHYRTKVDIAIMGTPDAGKGNTLSEVMFLIKHSDIDPNDLKTTQKLPQRITFHNNNLEELAQELATNYSHDVDKKMLNRLNFYLVISFIFAFYGSVYFLLARHRHKKDVKNNIRLRANFYHLLLQLLNTGMTALEDEKDLQITCKEDEQTIGEVIDEEGYI